MTMVPSISPQTLAPGAGEHCTILQKPLDYVMQGALALLAFGSLILKRYFESPRRCWLTFGLDTSKQCCGFALCHFINMAQSELLKQPNFSPCEWYWINIVLDTTVRVVVAYGLFRLIYWLLDRYVVAHELASGEYGSPVVWQRFFKQLALWLVVVLLSRAMLAALIYSMPKQLMAVAAPLLAPLERYSKHDNGDLELVVVMLVSPTLLNILQLWIQDSFLKAYGMFDGMLGLIGSCCCCGAKIEPTGTLQQSLLDNDDCSTSPDNAPSANDAYSATAD